jgi:hypothetical protein
LPEQLTSETLPQPSFAPDDEKDIFVADLKAPYPERGGRPRPPDTLWEVSMSKAWVVAALSMLCASTSASAKDTQFWNLTAGTITSLQLSPAGRNDWGEDQTANDSDHSVDHDERLKIVGVMSGVYDVKVSSKTVSSCVIRDVVVKEGKVFSIDEKQAKNCRP